MIEGIRHPWTRRAFPSHNRRKACSFWIHSLLAERGGLGHWAVTHSWRVIIGNKEAGGVTWCLLAPQRWLVWRALWEWDGIRWLYGEMGRNICSREASWGTRGGCCLVLPFAGLEPSLHSRNTPLSQPPPGLFKLRDRSFLYQGIHSFIRWFIHPSISSFIKIFGGPLGHAQCRCWGFRGKLHTQPCSHRPYWVYC